MEMSAQQCLQLPPRCGQATQWDPPARRRQHVEAFKASAELARAHSDRGEHAAWAGRVAEVMGQNGITIDLQSPQPIPARHAKQQFLLCILFSNLATLQAPRTGLGFFYWFALTGLPCQDLISFFGQQDQRAVAAFCKACQGLHSSEHTSCMLKDCQFYKPK